MYYYVCAECGEEQREEELTPCEVCGCTRFELKFDEE
jgi:hypothetical protein